MAQGPHIAHISREDSDARGSPLVCLGPGGDFVRFIGGSAEVPPAAGFVAASHHDPLARAACSAPSSAGSNGDSQIADGLLARVGGLWSAWHLLGLQHRAVSTTSELLARLRHAPQPVVTSNVTRAEPQTAQQPAMGPTPAGVALGGSATRRLSPPARGGKRPARRVPARVSASVGLSSSRSGSVAALPSSPPSPIRDSAPSAHTLGRGTIVQHSLFGS